MKAEITTIIDGGFIDNTIWINVSFVNINRFTIINSINNEYSAGICVIEKHWWPPGNPPAFLTDISISNCILKNNNCGIRLSYADTVDISNCIISDNLGLSIYIVSSSQVNINQCKVYNNGEQAPGGYNYLSAITIWADPFCGNESNNIDISHCDIKNNLAKGVVISGGCSEIRVHHNIISGNKDKGIFATGSFLGSPTNLSIYNNEIGVPPL